MCIRFADCFKCEHADCIKNNQYPDRKEDKKRWREKNADIIREKDRERKRLQYALKKVLEEEK